MTRTMLRNRLLSACYLVGLAVFCSFSAAQDQRQEETQDYYQKWLKTDAIYIITDEEKVIFQELTTDEERERFIEAFWKRRDPDPRTPENEFKTEHYRRIAYANDKFAAGMPGWRTDRGEIYIKFGPPAQVDVYPTGTVLRDYRGGSIQGALGERGTTQAREIRTYPFEVWRYRYLEGIGTDIEIEFVDKTGAGIYSLAMDEDEKNVFGFKDPAVDPASPNQSEFLKTDKQRQFYRTELLSKLADAPPIQFNDLKQVVSSRIHYDDIPFRAETSILRVTDTSFYVPIAVTIPARHLDFRSNGTIQQASVNLFFQATNVQRRVVAVVEDTLKLEGTERQMEGIRRGSAVYQKKLLLPPGRYVLDLVVKDNYSEKLGTLQELLVVENPVGKVALSSLILADLIQPAGEGDSLNDPFVIGSHKVIPNVAAEYKQSKKFGLFFQIYGLAQDQTTLKPEVEMKVRLKQGEKVLLELVDDLSHFGVVYGETASVTVGFPLRKFPTGRIDVEVEVTDKIKGQSVSAETRFQVVGS